MQAKMTAAITRAIARELSSIALNMKVVPLKLCIKTYPKVVYHAT